MSAREIAVVEASFMDGRKIELEVQKCDASDCDLWTLAGPSATTWCSKHRRMIDEVWRTTGMSGMLTFADDLRRQK